MKSRKLFYLELADGGNTQIQVSLGDDAPEDVSTFIGAHRMAGDLSAPYLHEILSPIVKENRGRGVVFNQCGRGVSKATSHSFHHDGSTRDQARAIEIVHLPSSSTLPPEPQQKLVSEFASFSTTLNAGYDSPFAQNGVFQTVSEARGRARSKSNPIRRFT
ncbi:hypothetical protein FRC00_006346 [Tulasnella sp. 408]|nr:hypothetical protein FRC00_006346 [Tulasnella sp. 408]